MAITMKRILSVLLCLSVLLSMLLVPVSAASRTGDEKDHGGFVTERTHEQKAKRSACTAEGGEHSFGENGLCTVCGEPSSDAVALVSKNGISIKAYTSLDSAISAVSSATASDEAVVMLLCSVDLNEDDLDIYSGVFTIDLNGCKLSNTSADLGVLYISGADTDVTVTDSGTTGEIVGEYTGIDLFNGTLTISGGTISAQFGIDAMNGSITVNGGTNSAQYGINAYDCDVNIDGGTIESAGFAVFANNSSVDITKGTVSGSNYGVYASSNTTVTLSGGTIIGGRGIQAENDTVTVSITGGTIDTSSYAVNASGSTVTISGGSIDSDNYDLNLEGCNATLTLGENGMGATFPGGIDVLSTSLNDILGEGAAYWLGDKMIIPADDATKIIGGDVFVKAVCTHENATKAYTNHGATHTYTYSCCNLEVTEEHSYGESTLTCVCGADGSDAVVMLSKDGTLVKFYTDLQAAITEAKQYTAEDKAELTLLKSVNMGDDDLNIWSGTYTLNLGGFTLTSTMASAGAVGINGNADLIITNGTFEGDNCAIQMNGGKLMLRDLTLKGTAGVRANGGETTVHHCSLEGTFGGLYVNGGSVTVYGGSISGVDYDVNLLSGSVVLCEGVTFPGDIIVYTTNLNTILGEGMAYWQGDQMIVPADDATEITGGDVTVKAACTHENATATYEPNGENHLCTYPCCGASFAEDHSSDDAGVVTEPNCTEGGYTTYTCTACGESYKDDYVDALGHSADEGIVTAPTCTEDGYTTYTCTLCGESYTDDVVAALGHSYGEDGNCSVCGHNINNIITINMTDSYGDGWNGNALEVYESGELIATITIENGTTATWTGEYDPEKAYEFYWAKGSYAGECSFEILFGQETVFTATTDDCEFYSDGYCFFTKCEHVYGEGVVTAPTCTEDGYTTYTCTRCGNSYTEDVITASGHNYGEDGICSGCGHNKNNIITINMTDTYGDGWNGNAIKVYEDGELIDTVTFDDGKTAIWAGDYDPEKAYEFYWVKDNYADECSFGILFGQETVFTATTDDCKSYPDGYRFFPVCEHIYDEGVVTPVTCTEQGYTTYTCTLCGLSYEDDYVDASGHIKSDDDEGVVTAPTCTDQGYTTYTCITCGESYNDVYVDALDHTKDEGVVTAPTCTGRGYTTYTCTVCGSLFYDEHVDALGHTKDEGVVTAPTCDAFGYTTYTCTTCGTSFEDDFVSALGHVLGEDGNCTVCGELYSIPVMVAGVQIDYENMADILGDGTASYDADTNTLTLNDFEYDGSSMGVHSKMPLNIVLVGENLITTEDFGMMFEEIFNGDINISGTGSLTINSIKEGIAAYAVNEVSLTLSGSVVITIDSDNNEGIYLKGIDADLLIEDNVIVTIGTEDDPIDAECLYVPAETEGSITITDDATVSVYNTDEEGIYIGGESQTLTISGNATVYIDADEEGIDVGTVIISGGTVTSFGGEDYEGIYAEELTISGGNVTAGTTGTGSPEGDGIEADYIEILGGTVTVTSGGMIAVVTDEDGYQVPGTITLAEGMIIESPESGELGEYDLSENEEGVVSTVLNSDGSFATALTITDGEVCDLGTLTIEMKDSYGDSWAGNAIEIYEDGELVGTATVEEGSEATWTGEYDPDKEYEFYWTKGDYPEDCSFEILIDGEVVYSADSDTCRYFVDGQMIYPESDREIAVYVCGVALHFGEYLDTEGNVTMTRPYGGYAHCDDDTLILNEFSYTGVPAATIDGLPLPVFIYAPGDELKIELWGENTFTLSDETRGCGIIVGDTSLGSEIGVLTVHGDGILNMSGDSLIAISADDITIDSGVVNFNADCGSFSSFGDSKFTVNGGDLIIDTTSTMEDRSYALDMGHVTINGGRVILASDQYAINGATLTVNGGCLEVEQGAMALWHPTMTELITIGEGISITSPEGAKFGTFTEDDFVKQTICHADGSIADAFVIKGEEQITPVEVFNNYGVADTVTLSNPNAIVGQNYVTTVSASIGTDIGVWGVYVPQEDAWYGNSVYYFDEDTHTLTVFAEYVEEGLKIEVAPFVTLTTHLNGGAVNEKYQYTYEADENGTLVVNRACGYVDYFFTAWDSEADESIPDANLIFEREGYTVVGYNTAADGSGTDYAMDTIYSPTEDIEIYLIWKSEEATGWCKIDGSWYYIDEETGLPKTGISRVPYPTEAINGVTYAPDQEAMDYCAANGTTFIDATEGWFRFDDQGVFCASFTGQYDYYYFENGFMTWHPGLTEFNGNYYYFTGDMQNGGNKTASGNVYVSKNQTDLPITIGGIYTFNTYGRLCEYDGITNIDGTLYYYEDYQLMVGKGLIKVEDDYYYVRSDGSLVVDQSYWVANVNEYTEIEVGMHEFDENGKLVIYDDSEKNGIYYENGAWYYYENGAKGYNKGLIFTTLHWYDENGNDIWDEGATVYVRADASLATGSYYVTNIDNYNGEHDIQVGDRMDFNDMGMMFAPKNGIVAENGSLYYYINNKLQYNAGIIEIDGNYYYVRSNGEVVNGRTYWVSNVGDSGIQSRTYRFDTNGVMQNPKFVSAVVENGIVDGYYYIGGKIAYNAGLVYLEDEGCYIYVRSNGMIATGRYWITNHHGLLPAGIYDFGTDGKLYMEKTSAPTGDRQPKTLSTLGKRPR